MLRIVIFFTAFIENCRDPKKTKSTIDNCTPGLNHQFVTNWSELLGEQFGSSCVEIVGFREHREGRKGKERDREQER